jgi:hypothetical protein
LLDQNIINAKLSSNEHVAKYLFDINVELLALDIKLFRVHEIAYVFGGPSEKNVSH